MRWMRPFGTYIEETPRGAFGRVYTGTRDIFGGRTELTEVSGTRYGVRTEPCRSLRYGVEAVPNFAADFGGIFPEQRPPIYFGTYPTEHTVGTNRTLPE